jgi:transposase
LLQIIWASFIGNKFGPIVFIKGMINADLYIDVLTSTFLSFIDVLRVDDTTTIVFQQDNAIPYTAKKTKEFLDSATRAHSFSVIVWPLNSPDMNPMEHLWAHIKLELHHKYPDTARLIGHPDTVRTTLQQRLMDI